MVSELLRLNLMDSKGTYDFAAGGKFGGDG